MPRRWSKGTRRSGLPGDFLNSSFADRHTCSVDAISQATVDQFPRQRFLTFLETHPTILCQMLEAAGEEIEATREHMLLLGCNRSKLIHNRSAMLDLRRAALDRKGCSG